MKAIVVIIGLVVLCANLGTSIPVGSQEEQGRQKRQWLVPSVAVPAAPAPVYTHAYVQPPHVVVSPPAKVTVPTGHTESYVFHHSPEATYYIHQRHPHYSEYYYPPTTHYVSPPVYHHTPVAYPAPVAYPHCH